MSRCSGERTGTDRYHRLKDLQNGFRKLKQREKAEQYRADDNDCKEATRSLIANLRGLTDSGLDDVLPFAITEKGYANRVERELKNLKEAYDKKDNEFENEKRNHEKSKDRLKRDLNQAEKELQQLKEEIKRVHSELQKNENANGILERENASLISERERIKSELGDSEEDRRNLEDEIKTLNDRIKSLELEVKDGNDAREKLDTEYRRLNETTQRQRERDIGEIKTLNSMLGQLELEKEKLENDKNSYKKESEQLRKELRDVEKTQRELITTIDNKDQHANHLMSQIRLLQQECYNAKSSIETQRTTIDKLQKYLTEEKRAKEHALNRLSAAAAHRLRDQNPGITDLSDPNRPLKLAEKVSELYDNEWTNAMENLETLDVNEEKGIRILLKIIKNVFDTCVEFGDTHLESFPDLLVLPPVIYQLQKERVLSVKEMSPEMLKPMKDYRKSNAEHAISQLQKYIAAERKSKLHIKHMVYEACKEYIEKCVELCWMMRIQDPPIYMEASYKTNSAFDSNKMRSYTKAGKLVHFVVWPTFFLCKDGPLLAKGVVQGSKSEIAEEDSRDSSADDTEDDEGQAGAQTDSRVDNESRQDDSVGNQSHPENGNLPNKNNNATRDTGNQSDPGNGELPSDNSNASNGHNRPVVDNKRDDNPDGTQTDLGSSMTNNTPTGTDCVENDDKKEDTDNDDVDGSGDKATNDRSFTDEQEIDS